MSTKGVALVTGAARGIGRAIALRLAEDGFDVAINDLPGTQELAAVIQELSAKGRRVHSFEGDVTVEQDVKNMIKSTVDALGSLDVLVANAGILALDSVLTFTVEGAEKIFATNIRGVMLCYKYAAEQMIAQGRGGRIIAASSSSGKRGYNIGFAYSASKFAVRGLTQSAALELGQYGITVNAYAPGATETRMINALNNDQAAGGLTREAVTSALAIKRIGIPQDVASLVSFLASKEANYISGQTVSVDGGLNLS
ncbi:acetoin reductase family protein [Auriscalpium vulgare]|uniref:Acetoin reductase family protein n=1 Tax=Auriscalpium vulgare TaxID=40419 RepID=A0ACB8S0I3_9AGAM|nr:acetoin reductase family protein [Auriscalpium vulgare]